MKAIKNILIILTVLLCITPSKAKAQRDKIDELRSTFIAKHLDFSSAESEKFWPIYNELHDKRKAIKKNLRQSLKNLPPAATDKEAEELINLENKSAAADAELTKTYNDKLKLVIGAKKLAKLKVVEEEFKLEVLKAAKEK
ncbi:MAG: hypothetical protein SGJ15_13650 [Bacteroidota bacterium]|nr:hypothetical protein [Bacteroidota bacterium]